MRRFARPKWVLAGICFADFGVRNGQEGNRGTVGSGGLRAGAVLQVPNLAVRARDSGGAEAAGEFGGAFVRSDGRNDGGGELGAESEGQIARMVDAVLYYVAKV